MRMEVERDCIVIYAENDQDVAYFEDTLKIQHRAEGTVSRLNRDVSSLSDIDNKTVRPALHIQARVEKESEWYDRFWEISHILEMPGAPDYTDVIERVRELHMQYKIDCATHKG